jgi:hypothetical protein
MSFRDPKPVHDPECGPGYLIIPVFAPESDLGWRVQEGSFVPDNPINRPGVIPGRVGSG